MENGGASNPDGSEDLYEVVYVEHVPIAAGEASFEQPSAKIIVEWITGLHGLIVDKQMRMGICIVVLGAQTGTDCRTPVRLRLFVY